MRTPSKRLDCLAASGSAHPAAYDHRAGRIDHFPVLRLQTFIHEPAGE